MNLKERMKSSKLYFPTGESLVKEQTECLKKVPTIYERLIFQKLKKG